MGILQPWYTGISKSCPLQFAFKSKKFLAFKYGKFWIPKNLLETLLYHLASTTELFAY